MCESSMTDGAPASTELNVTSVAVDSPVPVIVTTRPTGPNVGANRPAVAPAAAAGTAVTATAAAASAVLVTTTAAARDLLAIRANPTMGTSSRARPVRAGSVGNSRGP